MLSPPQYRDLLHRILTLERRLTSGGSGGTPNAHATSHEDGGSDELDVTNLGGFPGGSTTFLRADGTFATPSVGSLGDLLDIQFARKTGDTSRTNQTISDDPDLTFSVSGSGQVWTVRGVFMVDGAQAGDFDYSWNTPASSTGWHSGHRLIGGTTATSADLQTSATETLTTDRTAGLAGAGSLMLVTAEAYIVTGGSGSITLQWAQNTTDATATILKAGSFIEAKRWV